MSAYALAWLIYLVAVALAWGIAWRLSWRWPRWLSWALLGLMLALLLPSVGHPSHPDWRVPAIMVLVLGTLSEGWEAVGAPALSLLLLAAIPALLLGAGLGWWRRNAAPGAILNRDEIPE